MSELFQNHVRLVTVVRFKRNISTYGNKITKISFILEIVNLLFVFNKNMCDHQFFMLLLLTV